MAIITYRQMYYLFRECPCFCASSNYSIVVSSTVRASPLTHIQRQGWNSMITITTGLRRWEKSIHLDQYFARTLTLIVEHSNETRPATIAYRCFDLKLGNLAAIQILDKSRHLLLTSTGAWERLSLNKLSRFSQTR
jgi:hypothetical protein